ncbi:MAG TPA: hypothetical protein VKA54_14740 [Gemmatimonadaceae bacterium]|nr:hypothetical protein [Gemmatimonadaceae bacterium]
MTDETRTRFLAAIAAQVPIERIAEVHLFPAIRQGGMESGVAVIAVERAHDPAVAEPEIDEPAGDERKVDELGIDELGVDEREVDAPALDDAASDAVVENAPVAARRYTVFSARYRHTLKGPDRGKWEVSVTEEADAPLLTIDAVVRGVQRRSGDAEEIVRLSGDEVRAALPVAAAS